MNKTLVAIVATGASIVFLTGCASKKDSYDAVCVNPQNNIRIDEDFCEEDDDDFDPNIPHSWMFFRSGNVPGMGQVGNGGVNSLPNNSRANYLSTDSDSKHKTKPHTTTTVRVPTQAPRATTQAPKPSTAAPKANDKPAVRVVPAPSKPFSGGSTSNSGRSGGSSSSSSRSGR